MTSPAENFPSSAGCSSDSCPIKTPPACACQADLHKLQQCGRELIREIRRRKLGKVEYALAELLVEISYGWGRMEVIVPELDLFGVLAGVARPHISTNLAALIEMHLLDVSKTPTGPSYRINPNPREWMCAPRGVSRSQVREAMIKLRVFNHFEDAGSQGDAPHFFKIRDGAQILAEAITAPVTVTGELFKGGQP